MRYTGKQKMRQRPRGTAGWQIYNLISDCVEWLGHFVNAIAKVYLIMTILLTQLFTIFGLFI